MAALLLSGCAVFGGGHKASAPVPAPDFSVKLTDGTETSLGKLKGRPLVLSFAASWCPHCLNELPVIKKVSDKYKGEAGFLMIFVKSPEKDVKSLIDKHSLDCMVGLDPEAVVGKEYDVRGIPVTYFIDAGGNIVDEYFGGMDEARLAARIDGLIHQAHATTEGK
jgi:thiol-disulfide isomerase/thioredoxin